MRLRMLAFAGMMAGLAALLQTAPVWLGEPLGYILAIGACLPAATAASACPREALWAVVAAVLLCLLISPQEAVVFALTNGVMGLVLGWSARYHWAASALVTGFTLWVGMSVLTWVAGVAALGPELLGLGWLPAFLAYGAFSCAWCAIFVAAFRPIHRRVTSFVKAGAAPA